MRFAKLCSAFSLLAIVAACFQPQALIRVEADANDSGTAQGLSDIEVRFYPFDRDAVFDSLTSVSTTPEPQVPPELLAAQDSVASAQRAWQMAETEWQDMRDRLQTISNEIATLNRGEARYVQLFNEFRDLEGRVDAAERASQAAFQNFTALSEGVLSRAEQVRLLREQWEDDAFATVGEVFDAKAAEAGREVIYDTTGADGTAGPISAPAGQWWVFARYELPFEELYWNVPFTLEGSDGPMTVTLNAENAQRRPKL